MTDLACERLKLRRNVELVSCGLPVVRRLGVKQTSLREVRKVHHHPRHARRYHAGARRTGGGSAILL